MKAMPREGDRVSIAGELLAYLWRRMLWWKMLTGRQYAAG